MTTNLQRLESSVAHPSGASLVLRTQCDEDIESIVKDFCPRDQRRLFIGRWDGRDFRFEQAPTPDSIPKPKADKTLEDELARLRAMKEPDLKTLAAERSVEWDAKASLDTMILRVAVAAKK
jgi:hypothetical protein